MGLVALVVVAWFFLCGVLLKELSLPSQGVAFYNLMILLGGTGGVFFLGLWGGFYIVQLFRRALRMARSTRAPFSTMSGGSRSSPSGGTSILPEHS
jgi:hypothetical protein